MTLAARLDALVEGGDQSRRLAADPVRFPRRYTSPADQEVAALIAASLAYGRVDLFGPVLERVFGLLDARGGPRAAVDAFDPRSDAADFLPIVYRWNRGIDLVLLLATLRRLLGDEPMASRFTVRRGERDVREALERFVAGLREAAVEVAPACGLGATSFGALPRGFRTLLPSPADGSACKRWNMMLRWLVRPDDGVDLGLWTHVPTRRLVVPLDTHVGRIARFVGLTDRTDGSWRTAREVTDGLAALNAKDPIRYDFALAHLGISGKCRGRYVAGICSECPLVAVCVAARTG